jgi:hypothetical protein
VRNKELYLKVLKDHTKEWAYEYITENLKRPDFVYEPQNAHEAYKEIFGVDFASPEEIRAMSQAEEIERLKAELELVKIAQKKEVVEPIKEVEEAVNELVIENPFKPEPTPKEQFKELHPELKGLDLHRAWLKYAKANGIPK